ncbi:septum formation initiator family protein [Candidatus Bipolaricaulota bacterium]|nr:septum formation initiator family protein [Candidatus Bipolaricaulota bacterium]
MDNRTVPVLLIIALLIAGFLGWIYWKRFQNIFSLQAEIAQLKEERDDIRQDISELLDKRNKRNDLDYIEKLAKEELGFIYPPDEEPEENG